ncbi:MucR family transcriptional regulator [Geoalkalibacter subterraneus]|uniref:MucR family transcriptional regulator n=1 Tax=Geoalkalibacter subterraneus TaxID=483547 RepID=A0A0B5FVD8_9BACT|nr:MucR family transcriptional regulator [Geoalkalibacter subterraneus]AJF08145.1 MucR family transcriptional regulator [Geoalkalibacter subterraneus]
MATLLEMAAEIVAAHASTTQMSKEDLVAEIREIHDALSAIEKGEELPKEGEVKEQSNEPVVSRKKAFGKDKVTCMICGKEMTTLSRHLKTSHDMKPTEYRKRFDIPRSQPLAAKNYSEKRREMAKERGLGENLAKARAARKK